ncbi:hypothetical protein NX059_012239 [Plenodomus lindquistii]|nr:hypothetical protein NX059_012239 [Plenodomus lindquistii]
MYPDADETRAGEAACAILVLSSVTVFTSHLTKLAVWPMVARIPRTRRNDDTTKSRAITSLLKISSMFRDKGHSHTSLDGIQITALRELQFAKRDHNGTLASSWIPTRTPVDNRPAALVVHLGSMLARLKWREPVPGGQMDVKERKSIYQHPAILLPNDGAAKLDPHSPPLLQL